MNHDLNAEGPKLDFISKEILAKHCHTFQFFSVSCPHTHTPLILSSLVIRSYSATPLAVSPVQGWASSLKFLTLVSVTTLNRQTLVTPTKHQLTTSINFCKA